MDKSVQLSIITVVGVVSTLSLLKGNTDVVQCGIAGLIGFLGAKSMTPDIQDITDNTPKK